VPAKRTNDATPIGVALWVHRVETKTCEVCCIMRTLSFPMYEAVFSEIPSRNLMGFLDVA
jgi:hypothetical protein